MFTRNFGICGNDWGSCLFRLVQILPLPPQRKPMKPAWNAHTQCPQLMIISGLWYHCITISRPLDMFWQKKAHDGLLNMYLQPGLSYGLWRDANDQKPTSWSSPGNICSFFSLIQNLANRDIANENTFQLGMEWASWTGIPLMGSGSFTFNRASKTLDKYYHALKCQNKRQWVCSGSYILLPRPCAVYCLETHLKEKGCNLKRQTNSKCTCPKTSPAFYCAYTLSWIINTYIMLYVIFTGAHMNTHMPNHSNVEIYVESQRILYTDTN